MAALAALALAGAARADLVQVTRGPTAEGWLAVNAGGAAQSDDLCVLVSDHVCVAGIAVGATGPATASACPRTGAAGFCIGPAVSVSGTGAADGGPECWLGGGVEGTSQDFCGGGIAVTGTGASRGSVAVSGTGPANAGPLCIVWPAFPEFGVCLVSVAVSGTGHASGDVAVSACDLANVCS